MAKHKKSVNVFTPFRKLLLEDLDLFELQKPLYFNSTLRTMVTHDFESESEEESEEKVKKNTKSIDQESTSKDDTSHSDREETDDDSDTYKPKEESDDDEDDYNPRAIEKRHREAALKRKTKKPTNTRDFNLARAEGKRNIKYFTALTKSPLYNTPGATLKDHQLVGLNWLRRNWYARRNSVLADEMGLGKTIQATALLHYLSKRYGINGPHLIVVPLSTLTNWTRELSIWTHLQVESIYNCSAQDLQDAKKNYTKLQTEIHLTTYESLKKYRAFFRAKKYSVIICDEAHKLKKKDTKARKILENIYAQHLLLLTGTPYQVNMEDLFYLMQLVDPITFDKAGKFLEKFGEIATKEQVLDLKKLISPYVLRRTKEDVLSHEMPPKEEVIVELELSSEQKTLYRAILERKSEFLRRKYKTQDGLSSVITSLKKCCNHPFIIRGVEDTVVAKQPSVPIEKLIVSTSSKLIFVDKLIDKILVSGEKLLVFCQMLDMLTILEDYLHFKKVEYRRLDGGVDNENRVQAIDTFNDDPTVKVFLLSTKAGGLGINLVAANHVVLFDSDFNPFNDAQASARCHRIGQNKKVMIYRLVMKNTYEMFILQKASKRLGLGEIILDQSGAHIGGVEEEIQDGETLDKMLKFGVYHLFLSNASEDLLDQNIDTILSKSKVVKEREKDPNAVNIFSGGDEFATEKPVQQKPSSDKPSAISTMYFDPEAATSAIDNVDVNDAQFWEKFFPEYTDVTTLEYRLDDAEPLTVQEVQRFMQQLRSISEDILGTGEKAGKSLYSDIEFDEKDKQSRNTLKNQNAKEESKAQLMKLLLKFTSQQGNMHYEQFTTEDRKFARRQLKVYENRKLRTRKSSAKTKAMLKTPTPLRKAIGEDIFDDKMEDIDNDDDDDDYMKNLSAETECFDKKDVRGFSLNKNKAIAVKNKKANVGKRKKSATENTAESTEPPKKIRRTSEPQKASIVFHRDQPVQAPIPREEAIENIRKLVSPADFEVITDLMTKYQLPNVTDADKQMMDQLFSGIMKKYLDNSGQPHPTTQPSATATQRSNPPPSSTKSANPQPQVQQPRLQFTQAPKPQQQTQQPSKPQQASQQQHTMQQPAAVTTPAQQVQPPKSQPMPSQSLPSTNVQIPPTHPTNTKSQTQTQKQGSISAKPDSTGQGKELKWKQWVAKTSDKPARNQPSEQPVQRQSGSGANNKSQLPQQPIQSNVQHTPLFQPQQQPQPQAQQPRLPFTQAPKPQQQTQQPSKPQQASQQPQPKQPAQYQQQKPSAPVQQFRFTNYQPPSQNQTQLSRTTTQTVNNSAPPPHAFSGVLNPPRSTTQIEPPTYIYYPQVQQAMHQAQFHPIQPPYQPYQQSQPARPQVQQADLAQQPMQQQIQAPQSVSQTNIPETLRLYRAEKDLAKKVRMIQQFPELLLLIEQYP